MNALRAKRFGNNPLRTIAAFGVVLAFTMASRAPGDEKPALAPALKEAKDKVAGVKENASAPVSGREIFLREWLPNDSRSHGGDGLGPVFNDSSCVACHNQGGAGGSGPLAKNVDIISAFVTPQNLSVEPSGLSRFFSMLAGQPTPTRKDDEKQLAARKERIIKHLKQELVKVHPGFGTARSVVLHHSSSDPKYDEWRSMFLANQFGRFVSFASPVAMSPPFEMPPTFVADVAEPQTVSAEADIELSQQPNTFDPNTDPQLVRQVAAAGSAATILAGAQGANMELQRVRAAAQSNSSIASSTVSHGEVHTISSQRNPTALFGVGLIDSIPDAVLEAQAKVKHKDRAITGRVSRMKDGKIGRFGWKAQKVNLYDFTVTACGVELGLNVPDHPQSGQPLDPKYRPAGYDLNQREVDALVDHLRKLPAPAQSNISDPRQREYVETGRKAFSSVGCADCHVQKLGNVEGIYSDLLLHDMGEENADTGGYGVFVPESPGTETGDAFPALADAFTPTQQQRFLGFGAGLVQPDEKTIGATRVEWRTPPLWGVRDSSPYMHDGRAKTLEHAIAMHGGEAGSAARNYFGLPSEQRQQLVAFLKTLVAPSEVALAE